MRVLALLAGLCSAFALADDKPAAPPLAPPPAPADDVADHARFAALVQAAHRATEAAPAYRVRVESQWRSATFEGDKSGPERTGSTRLELLVSGASKLRLALLSPTAVDGANGPIWEAVGDGTKLLRRHRASGLFSITETDRPADTLLRDADATRELRLAGVEFLLRNNWPTTLAAQTRAVDEVGGAKTGKRYRIALADGRVAEIDLAGTPALPVRTLVTRTLPLADGKQYRVATEAQLTWEMLPAAPADAFTWVPKAGVRQVDDLAEALATGSPAGLAGKPCPDLALAGLDGQPWRLADHKGKSPVVLYFWATWAAPSTATLAEVQKFVGEYSGKGAVFAAVNAGEAAADVKAFAEREKLTVPVALDPDGEALHTLRIGDLPAVVVVDREGVVQAFHRGNRPNTLARLKADLDLLLAGKSLVPVKP